jgi:hypothetical protein
VVLASVFVAAAVSDILTVTMAAMYILLMLPPRNDAVEPPVALLVWVELVTMAPEAKSIIRKDVEAIEETEATYSH